MFAVVAFGGKQYKFEPNFISEVEKIEGKVGDVVTFENVIFIVNDDESITESKTAVVSGIIARQFKCKKIRVFKKRQRTSGFEKSQGHRQANTGILIKEIKFN